MSRTPEVDLATAEAELAAWARVRDQLLAQLAAANSEYDHWQGVVDGIRKATK